MAIPFTNPLFSLLPDGGIYDPETALPLINDFPTGRQRTNKKPSNVTPTTPATTIDGYDINSPSVAPAPSGFTIKEPEMQPVVVNETQYINWLNTGELPSNGTNTIGSGGNVGGSAGAGFNTQFQTDLAREATNARAIFSSIFKQYFNRPGDDKFVSDLTRFLEDSIDKGYTEQTISALLPQTEAYKTRFKGNEGRVAAGLAAYSPGEYLQAEDTYAEILNRFNLGDLATREEFANLIGNRKSASEVVDLVQNVYFRIQNADPALRQQLNQLKDIGNLKDSDLAQAILSGKDAAKILQQKIAGAEVATEAAVRGLSTSRSQDLANLGVTREQARSGFETIAQAQPTFEKLAGIYDREALAPETSQTELEREVFQGMASERRKRLVQREAASFSGASGISGSALSTQRAGQI